MPSRPRSVALERGHPHRRVDRLPTVDRGDRASQESGHTATDASALTMSDTLTTTLASTSMRRSLALFLAALLLLLSAQVALAARPTHDWFAVDDTFSDNVSWGWGVSSDAQRWSG